jgi:DNA-binding transcriptional regulator GbsR (MarR family)
MTIVAEKSESVLLRLRKQDTPTGVSISTIDLLMEQTGMSKTEVIHLALRQLADRYLPKYELDDGPLTDAQMAAIRAASPVSNLPEERITRRLF